jgi:hypothetical protein
MGLFSIFKRRKKDPPCETCGNEANVFYAKEGKRVCYDCSSKEEFKSSS